jgi:hypothetical protein
MPIQKHPQNICTPGPAEAVQVQHLGLQHYQRTGELVLPTLSVGVHDMIALDWSHEQAFAILVLIEKWNELPAHIKHGLSKAVWAPNAPRWEPQNPENWQDEI